MSEPNRYTVILMFIFVLLLTHTSTAKEKKQATEKQDCYTYPGNNLNLSEDPTNYDLIKIDQKLKKRVDDHEYSKKFNKSIYGQVCNQMSLDGFTGAVPLLGFKGYNFVSKSKGMIKFSCLRDRYDSKDEGLAITIENTKEGLRIIKSDKKMNSDVEIKYHKGGQIREIQQENIGSTDKQGKRVKWTCNCRFYVNGTIIPGGPNKNEGCSSNKSCNYFKTNVENFNRKITTLYSTIN